MVVFAAVALGDMRSQGLSTGQASWEAGWSRIRGQKGEVVLGKDGNEGPKGRRRVVWTFELHGRQFGGFDAAKRVYAEGRISDDNSRIFIKQSSSPLDPITSPEVSVRCVFP